MTTWEDRKAVGDAHEQRVTEELTARGWEVARCGQGILPPRIRDAISLNDHRDRHQPDLIAERDGDVIKIDCKDRMRSTQTDRYAISRNCVSVGLHIITFGPPLFYVFGNLGVLTPSEVMAYGTVGPRVRGGAYYLVPGRLARNFDDVFGVPEIDQAAA